MAVRNNFEATLPATRCTTEMRERTAIVAQAAGCDMADVIRDALVVMLPSMELQLGLKGLDDFDEEELARMGLSRRKSDDWTIDPSTLAQINELAEAATVSEDTNLDLDSVEEPVDREPQPSDGPDYHAEHAAWAVRRKVKEDRTRGLAWGPPAE